MPSASRARTALSDQPVIFHARHEHGGHPVHVLGADVAPEYEVHWPKGTETYSSARKLFKALYNDGDTSPGAKDPHMTVARYCRLNRIKQDESGPTVFDLFTPEGTPKPVEPRIIIPPRRRGSRPQRRCPASAGRWYRRGVAAAFTTLALFGSLELAEAAPSPVIENPYSWADVTPEPGQLSIAATSVDKIQGKALSVAPVVSIGIDLGARGHEVRKLLFKGFGRRIGSRGFEIEDVLQEVYKGLLTRNDGKCPFDPRKSSFGHYVHMVCGCILSNYERKMGRRREHEQLGMYVPGGSEDQGMVDAALGATDRGGEGSASSALGVEAPIGTERAFKSLLSTIGVVGRDRRGRVKPEAELAARCLPLVYAGHQRAEIAKILGEDASKVGRALSLLRKSAATWRDDEGLA